ERHASDLSLPETPLATGRYYSRNDYFPIADGLMLATMLMEHKPQHYLEIGSGFSSALALDIGEMYFAEQLQYTFIEPNPDRLQSLLRAGDHERASIIREKVQNVASEIFQQLKGGDVLFVDGSH